VVERGIAVSAIILRSVVRPSVAASLLLGMWNILLVLIVNVTRRCILREEDDLTLERFDTPSEMQFLSIEEGITFMQF
jgi:hypothetical protein